MNIALDEALTDIKIAFIQVEFSIKLLSYCELKKINPAEFDTEQIVLLEHENLIFPSENFRRQEDIIRAAGITVSSAFGASALDTQQSLGRCRCRPRSSIHRRNGEVAHTRVYGAMRVRPWHR